MLILLILLRTLLDRIYLLDPTDSTSIYHIRVNGDLIDDDDLDWTDTEATNQHVLWEFTSKFGTISWAGCTTLLCGGRFRRQTC